MTWLGDPRTSNAAWRRKRARILRRDRGVCHVCGKPGADEVDHLVPVAGGGSDHESNLAAIHRRPCHARKSAAEGNRARWKHKRKRPPEQHPGLR